MIDSGAELLAACRRAGLGSDNDAQRLAVLGKQVSMIATLPSAGTVLCTEPPVGHLPQVYLPISALRLPSSAPVGD